MNTHAGALAGVGAGILVWAGAVAYAGGEVNTTFHLADFSTSSATIDNQYWPQPAGTKFTYRSVGRNGCEVNDVQVTDMTPTIVGVTTRQLFDQVYEDDSCSGNRDFLSEDALDWYAQDAKGNVWHFGEDAKSFCDRNNPDLVCDTVGSWKAGVDGAAPGIVMLAAPSPGHFYRQEYAADAHDFAKVLRLNADVKLGPNDPIDADRYTGCLITKEWSPLAPGVINHKFYCPGTGLVLINELPSDEARTELVSVAQR
jgi:hypothetical protein